METMQAPTTYSSSSSHDEVGTPVYAGINGAGSSPEARLMDVAKMTWPWLLIAGLLSAAAGYFWADKYASTSYEVASRLVFNKTYFGAPLYQGLDIRTLLNEFQTKETIEELIAKRGLETPVAFVNRQIKTSVEGGDSSVTVSFTWSDQKDATEMLDELVRIGLEKTRRLRDAGLNGHIEGLNKELAELNLPEVADLKQQYEKLSQANGVTDISIAFEEWKAKLDTLEAELRAEQATFLAVQEQSDKLVSGVALVMTSVKGKDFVPETKTPSPIALINKITALEKDIQGQRSMVVLEAKLNSKEAELARITPLVSRGLIPQSKYNEMLAEVEQLRLEARGDGAIVDMEEQLDRLNREMENFGDDPTSALEAAKESSRIKSVLDTEVATSRIRIEHLESSISYLEPKLKDLEIQMVKARDLEKMIAIAESKLEMKETVADQLRTLKYGDAHGFRVVDAATPTMSPEKSDFRKLFATVFMLCMIGLATPVLGVALALTKPSPADSLAERLNLVQIGRFSKGDLKSAQSGKLDLTKSPEAARLVAVRLQYLAEGMTNRLIHVVGISGRTDTVEATKHVASEMAKLGNDVSLVIVADSSAADESEFDEVLENGQPARLRILKTRSIQADDILSRLHSEVRSDSMVLITGLSCKARAEIELLSLKSGAVVLSAPAAKNFTPAANDVIGSLVVFNAPIMGIIS